MALRKFYSTNQSNSSSCDEYFGTMTNLRDVISQCGRFIGNHTFLIDKLLKASRPEDTNEPTDDDTEAAKNATK